MNMSLCNGHPGISLVPMTQQLEVRNSFDDWTGVTSSAERRKLQNRLNQRAHRGEQQKKNHEETLQRIGHKEAEQPPRTGSLSTELQQFMRVIEQDWKGCASSAHENRARLVAFARQAYDDYMSGTPRHTQLPTVVKINVFTAVNQNALALNLSPQWLDGEAVSPFGSLAPKRALACPTSTVYPDSLRPTPCQLSTPHHPWIDLLPFPRLRDNILYAINLSNPLDEDALCLDMVDISDLSYDARYSIVVWGSPWDPNSWEVTPDFARKWGVLLRGCHDLLVSTNYWRLKRGERGLMWQL
ncbi:hypothetical protein GQ53DRAFT_723354 [Thozetella sp. PMI_491]|nr:hypothetical protein GQ53DRAFT_723354 [Thozetella sp. PMI_491]